MQWASGEGLSEVGPMGASTLQFPLLRTTADLLMMPKELLMEPAIRRDVAQALSIRWGGRGGGGRAIRRDVAVQVG